MVLYLNGNHKDNTDQSLKQSYMELTEPKSIEKLQMVFSFASYKLNLFVLFICSPDPIIKGLNRQLYDVIMYAFMGSHNFFSLMVLISYLLLNHPRLPTPADISAPFKYVNVITSFTTVLRAYQSNTTIYICITSRKTRRIHFALIQQINFV